MQVLRPTGFRAHTILLLSAHVAVAAWCVRGERASPGCVYDVRQARGSACVRSACPGLSAMPHPGAARGAGGLCVERSGFWGRIKKKGLSTWRRMGDGVICRLSIIQAHRADFGLLVVVLGAGLPNRDRWFCFGGTTILGAVDNGDELRFGTLRCFETLKEVGKVNQAITIRHVTAMASWVRRL